MRGVSLTHPVLPRLFCKESFSYTSRASFLFFLFYILFCFIGEFLLNIPYWLHFSVRSFSCTSNVGFILFGGVPLTHPMLASFLSGEFLLNIPCSLFFFFSFFLNLGSFSYTSHADFVFNCGVSVTLPVVPSFLSREFLLHIPCCPDLYARSFSYLSRACILFFFFSSFFFFFSFFLIFYFIGGVSITHPVPASFLYGEFLLHPPCWL